MMLKKHKKMPQKSIPVMEDLAISTKRIPFDRKAFYAIKKERPNSTKSIITPDTPLGNGLKIIRLEPQKGYSSTMTRHLLKTEKKKLSRISYYDFKDKPDAKALDVVATRLKVSQRFNADEVKSLNKKLRRHRKKLGLVNMNTNIVTPDTPFGNMVKLINFGLNKGKKLSRSQRKKANRIEREKKKKYKEERVKKRLETYKKEFEKEEKREKRKADRTLQKKLTKEQRESALFLRTLKKIEKRYEGENNQDDHLDLLFYALGY